LATAALHVLGRIAFLVLRLQLARTAPRFLRDLKHDVERREPTGRKRWAQRDQQEQVGGEGGHAQGGRRRRRQADLMG